MKGSRDAGWGVCVRETSGGRGSTAGGGEEHRDGHMWEPLRSQADSELSLSEGGPDDPLASRGGGALRSSEAEKSMVRSYVDRRCRSISHLRPPRV